MKQLITLTICIGTLLSITTVTFAETPATKKIPVIYDSDIGDDIDDTWALALLLKSPEFDVKLVVGDMGKGEYRAKLFAKLLEAAGRTDIPVGVAMKHPKRKGGGKQSDWVKDYDLSKYPGKVHQDGVQAIIDTIMNSKETITLICVGPVPNIKEALKREPRIVTKARFVGMHGSVYKGYGGKKKLSAEYNVKADIDACQKTFSAKWEMTITPLDTCGIVRLRGGKYAAVQKSDDPLAKAVIENYNIWWTHHPRNKDKGKNEKPKASSTLFDTVAVYLAYQQELCHMERLPIIVDDKGFTRIDKQKGKQMEVATKWKDLGKFEDLIVKRLTGK